MRRFLTSCVIAALVATGAVPCMAAAPAQVASPSRAVPACGDMPGMGGANQNAVPTPANDPAGCCLVSVDPRMPAVAPAAAVHPDLRSIAIGQFVLFVSPARVVPFNDQLARARSAPPPFVLTPLLI